MRTLFIHSLLLACCLSYKPILATENIPETTTISFNAKKWRFKDAFKYSYRDSMLKDPI